ncbi:MAG: chromosomal replication initiator protein DnaA [Parcubacteria group bacterium]|nr:chromosomal replication initiator protein DnaA [Parcubacteria group bacterium]
MNLEQLWRAVLGELELQISKPNFITWLKSSRLTEKQEGIAVVSLPNNFAKEWVENKYHRQILTSLRNYDETTKKVEYRVHPTIFKTAPAQAVIAGEAQAALPDFKADPESGLNPRYSLNSFIVGSSNELAYAAALAIIKDVGKKYNPFFLYGGVGLGKTHLIQAIGNEIKSTYENKVKVRYVSSEKFTNDVIWAIRNKRMEDVKNKYRLIDVLIIDDIQFIGGKEKTEEEFFHTFNALYENNKQIIISSDRPPRSIPTLEERLRSRFEGGMIADINYPDYETRLAILKTKIQDRGMELSDGVCDLIARKIQRNIRELEGAINKIIFYQTTKNIVVDEKEAEKIISEIIQGAPKNANPSDIIKAVASFFEISQNDITGKSRKKEIVEPRQIAMFLLRDVLELSYPFIGEKLGNRDHTTAIHACEKITKEINKNQSLNQKILMIRERIYKN